jgi:hypothetical protein
VPRVDEQAALARMQALRGENKTYREIAAAIASEFKVDLQPMTIKRLLDRAAA